MGTKAQTPEATAGTSLPLARFAGEFVVIVAGVLGALVVDEWRQGLQDRSQEREYLNGLVEELRLDEGFVEVVANAARRRLEASDRILDALGSAPMPEPSIDYSPDSAQAVPLTSDLYESTRILTLLPARSVWEDLTNTGNLHLIADFELRRAISVYYQLQSFGMRDYPLLQGRVESLADALRDAGIVADRAGASVDLQSLAGLTARFVAARQAQVEVIESVQRMRSRTRALLEELASAGYEGPS